MQPISNRWIMIQTLYYVCRATFALETVVCPQEVNTDKGEE
jgi:hypothetical protein